MKAWRSTIYSLFLVGGLSLVAGCAPIVAGGVGTLAALLSLVSVLLVGSV